MLTRRKTNELVIAYGRGPLTPDMFEASVRSVVAAAPGSELVFDYAAVSFVPLDVQICSLLLYNDLARHKRRVELRWPNASNQVFKYAERMGFFRLLDGRVSVHPKRPQRGASLYDRHRGGNSLLLEICAIDIEKRATGDSTLKKLQGRLESNLRTLDDGLRRSIVSALWTFSAEVIGNIYEHSESPVPGIVAAQRYDGERGPRLHLVFADSGLGIANTIRSGRPQQLKGKTDVDIIFAAFRDGLSRNRLEVGRGCGLTRCASIAMEHQANLRVRTKTSWVKLITKSAKTGVTIGYFEANAAPIAGTQISFDFYVDRLSQAS
jgi:hypothetical protein